MDVVCVLPFTYYLPTFYSFIYKYHVHTYIAFGFRDIQIFWIVDTSARNAQINQ